MTQLDLIIYFLRVVYCSQEYITYMTVASFEVGGNRVVPTENI